MAGNMFTEPIPYISIHALRKESDVCSSGFHSCGSSFQSTLSVRRATQIIKITERRGNISIHALRKESDKLRLTARSSFAISIHALRKESDVTAYHQSPANALFQSTLSVRRATPAGGMRPPDSEFQSTLSVRRATTADDNVRIPAHFRFCSSLRC